MQELRGIDLKRAQLVPNAVFTSPFEVVEAGGLSLAQKLAILRRWEFDARRVGGFGGRPMLGQVQRALRMLAPETPERVGDPMSAEDPLSSAASFAGSRTASARPME